MWDAVGWNGEINDTSSPSTQKPSEEQFQNHLETLLNPEQPEDTIDLSNYNTYIPALDDPIVPEEVDSMRKKMKPKGSGPDGVDPGAFSWLPYTWVLILTVLYNLVFTCSYPLAWVAAKLSMLFKKGISSLCDNYRGISIINSCPKLYDYVLENRLVMWFKPQREQAGAQSKRGCMEHIVGIRRRSSGTRKVFPQNDASYEHG